MAHGSWDSLASKYEKASVRPDSLDSLLEWPAQSRAVGDVTGKRVIDVGCGSGRKALHFALSGAAHVTGIDISDHFISQWKNRPIPPNLEFFVGDLSSLSDLAPLAGQSFDVAVCFQAIAYSEDLVKTIRSIRGLLRGGGRFVLTTAHPFRYVIEKMERENLAPADAYRDEGVYRYPATWDPCVTVAHRKPMISTLVNALLANRFRLDRMGEPDLSEGQKRAHPDRAEWMARYFGTIVYEVTAV